MIKQNKDIKTQAIPDNKLRAIANMMELTASMSEGELSKLFPHNADKKKIEEEALKNPQVGQNIEGKGIYLGTWSPKDRDGNSLNKTFNLFAAPEDLTDSSTNTGGKKELRKFNETVAHVAGLNGWNGHDGFNHNVSGKTEDESLYDALKSGSYKGEWFIPTRDIVHGKDVDGNQVQSDNLYAHKDQRKLQGTFTTASGSDSAHWYWSCTERREDASGMGMYSVDFTDGVDGWARMDSGSLSGRVVRAELRV